MVTTTAQRLLGAGAQVVVTVRSHNDATPAAVTLASDDLRCAQRWIQAARIVTTIATTSVVARS